jgi:parallel beta-helix repeat protein
MFISAISFQDDFTIQAAIDNATPGDSIYVSSGTYYENVIVNKTVTIIGNGSSNTTIDGGGTDDVVLITADWVNVSGFRIINSGKRNFPDWDSGIIIMNAENITLSNNNISKNMVGIYFRDAKNVRIINNSLSLNKIHGLYGFYSYYNLIKNNTCFSNSKSGIVIFASDNNTISKNYCYSNTFNGIAVGKSHRNYILNNSCNSNQYGIWIQDGYLNILKNNNCTGNDLGIYCSKCNNLSIESNSILKNRNGIYQYGIDLADCNNCSVVNNNCYSNLIGIVLFRSTNNRIYNNNCSENNFGIFIDKRSEFNEVSSNICNYNSHVGIELFNSHYTTISNNTCIQNAEDGICLYNSNFNTIIENILLNNSQNNLDYFDLFLYSSKSITLEKNILSYSSLGIFGTELEYWNTHIIDETNIVDGKPIIYWKNRNGGILTNVEGQIIIANCTNIKIRDLYDDKNKIPLIGGYCKSSTIENNIFINNHRGMFFWVCENNIISNNTINLYNQYAIGLVSCENNIITDNTCDSSDRYGIACRNSHNNIISKNNILRNNEAGIFLNESNNNILSNNTVQLNHNYGLRIMNSKSNYLYYNNILNNTIQAVEVGDCNNQWDNAYGEGNYWSDYCGLDNGANYRRANDGTGDTNIPHLGLDYYPLMNCSGWIYPGIPILCKPDELDSDGCYEISWYPNRGTQEFVLEESMDPNFNTSIIVYTGTKLKVDLKNRPNSTYYYRLKALGLKFESCWSNIVQITVDYPPDTPENLVISTNPDGNALNLSWELTGVDVETYELYYKSENDDSWQLLVSEPPPKNYNNHTGLIDGLRYYYKHQAIDKIGQNSSFSEIISGIPQDTLAPKPPAGLNITLVTNDSINLTWVPNNEEDLMGYNIYRQNISNPNQWVELRGTVITGKGYFNDTDLNDNTIYFYVITAYDEVPNESDYSITISATTKKSQIIPAINESIQKIIMDEDSIDDSSISLNKLFKNINNETFRFWCEGQENITVNIIKENGTIILIPNKDWYGLEIVTFYVSNDNFTIGTTINIIVSPINDPPQIPKIISPVDETYIYEGNLLNFSCECFDPDLPNDELNYIWSSDLQGDIGTGEKLIGVNLETGEHIITLTVTDKAGESSKAIIHVYVLDVERTLNNQEDNINPILITAVGVIIIILLILIALFLILNKGDNGHNNKSGGQTKRDTRFSYSLFKYKSPSDRVDKNLKLETQQQKGYVKIKTVNIEELEFGKVYVLKTEDTTFNSTIIEKIIKPSFGSGFLITNKFDRYQKFASLSKLKTLQISNKLDNNTIFPGNVSKISKSVTEFLNRNRRGVILIDCLDELIKNNNFSSILKFLDVLQKDIESNTGILLILLNLNEIPQQHLKKLENKFRSFIKN